MTITVTGAAGNLGSLLSEYLFDNTDSHLNLLIHKKNVSERLQNSERVSIIRGDLAVKESFRRCVVASDVVIHFAGVLFKAMPESFLPTTNTQYFRNLCEVSIEENVKRIILVSFPHVEGETTPQYPSKGTLDGDPISVHAKTRLEEEKFLFECTRNRNIEAVSLRIGMVYGKGILMIDFARFLSKYWLLGIWKKQTWIHLISTEDYLEVTKNALIRKNITGIYHIGDNGVQTLQDFLERASIIWKAKKPWIMPECLIFIAAFLCELQSSVFGTKSPLTRDFVRIGMVSYYGDTTRMKNELLDTLKYDTFEHGRHTLQ